MMENNNIKKDYIIDDTFVGWFNIGDLVRDKERGVIFIFSKETYHCDFNRNYERVIEKIKE